MKYKAKHTSYNLNLLLKSQIGRAFVGTKMRGDTVEGNLEIIKSVSSFAKFAASLFILQTRKKHNSELIICPPPFRPCRLQAAGWRPTHALVIYLFKSFKNRITLSVIVACLSSL